jgi:hypothetical protein
MGRGYNALGPDLGLDPDVVFVHDHDHDGVMRAPRMADVAPPLR